MLGGVSFMLFKEEYQNRLHLSWEVIGSLFLMFFAFFLLSRAFAGQMWYAEIDSNALPTISMQYRGSIFIDESDLVIAQNDYPELYRGIIRK